MKQDKILGLIGLAKRAGRLDGGEFQAEKSVKDREAKLVLLAADASENTRKKFMDKASFRGIPVREYADKAVLGTATGASPRAVLTVKDKGFAEAILKLLDRAGEPTGNDLSE